VISGSRVILLLFCFALFDVGSGRSVVCHHARIVAGFYLLQRSVMSLTLVILEFDVRLCSHFKSFLAIVGYVSVLLAILATDGRGIKVICKIYFSSSSELCQ